MDGARGITRTPQAVCILVETRTGKSLPLHFLGFSLSQLFLFSPIPLRSHQNVVWFLPHHPRPTHRNALPQGYPSHGPDGMKVDERGNIFSSASGGVAVFFCFLGSTSG